MNSPSNNVIAIGRMVKYSFSCTVLIVFSCCIFGHWTKSIWVNYYTLNIDILSMSSIGISEYHFLNTLVSLASGQQDPCCDLLPHTVVFQLRKLKVLLTKNVHCTIVLIPPTNRPQKLVEEWREVAPGKRSECFELEAEQWIIRNGLKLLLAAPGRKESRGSFPHLSPPLPTISTPHLAEAPSSFLHPFPLLHCFAMFGRRCLAFLWISATHTGPPPFSGTC